MSVSYVIEFVFPEGRTLYAGEGVLGWADSPARARAFMSRQTAELFLETTGAARRYGRVVEYDGDRVSL
jgi:hypothetical protein